MIKYILMFMLMVTPAWGADVLLNFDGFESGSTLGKHSTVGSPSLQTTIKKSGEYALLLAGAATAPAVSEHPNFNSGGVGGTVATTPYNLVGFAFYATDVTPAAQNKFFQIQEAGAHALSMQLEADGDLVITDCQNCGVDTIKTITAPFSINTWYYIEVGVFRNNSGTGQLWINGVSQGTFSGDFFDNDTTLERIIFINEAGAGNGDYYYDNWYVLEDNADTAIPTPWALSDKGLEVFAYQSGKASTAADAGLTAADTTLAANNWDTCADIPWVDTDGATYTVDPSNGAVLYNDAATNGRGPGPSGGAYTVTGTIKGGKWSGSFDRGSGGGSTHTMYYGNSGTSPISSMAMTDPDADVLRAKVLEDTTVPTSGETFALGFGGAGAQDIWCNQLMGEILHLPAEAAPEFADVYYVTWVPQQEREWKSIETMLFKETSTWTVQP